MNHRFLFSGRIKTHCAIWLMLLVIVSLPLLASAGTGDFVPHPTIPAFGSRDSSDVALGDLDGDGDLDAVVANMYRQPETVWLNDGTGAFVANPAQRGFGQGESNTVVLGDLDADTDLDAVVGNVASGSKTVWLNNGAGLFTAHPTKPAFGYGNSHDVALGDLDADGDLDVIVANYQQQPEEVWFNDGAGVFLEHSSAPASSTFGSDFTYNVALADLDGDTDLDAIFANAQEQAETVWVNDGTGIFTPHPGTPEFGAGNSTDVAGGDLDGDSDFDVVVTNYRQPSTVWLNDGAGNFRPHSSASAFGTGPTLDVALGDLDSDGDLDAVVANHEMAAETVWLNDGAGVFSPHNGMPAFGGGSSYALALGDLDGDRDLDAIVANVNQEAETVWLNASVHRVYLPLVRRP